MSAAVLAVDERVSVAEVFAALPYPQQAAMCRVLGVDLTKMQERWLDDWSCFEVVVASECYRYTRPVWSVVLRGYALTESNSIHWVLDVRSHLGEQRAIFGLGPEQAVDLSRAIAEASGMLERLQEICA